MDKGQKPKKMRVLLKEIKNRNERIFSKRGEGEWEGRK